MVLPPFPLPKEGGQAAKAIIYNPTPVEGV